MKCCGLLRQLHMLYICVGISPATGKFPAQRACNAENVSIWLRHHVISWGWVDFFCTVYIHVAKTKKALIVVLITIVIIVIVYAGLYGKMLCFVCTLVKPGVFGAQVNSLWLSLILLKNTSSCLNNSSLVLKRYNYNFFSISFGLLFPRCIWRVRILYMK